MSFIDLVKDSVLQGEAPRLDGGACTRLGRAFGTTVRRRTSGGAQIVVIARGGDGVEIGMRDGLVRGLLLAGHDVRDIGVADEALFSFALGHLGAAGGALVLPASNGTRSLALFLGKRTLSGDALLEVAQLAGADDHAAGAGSLALVDVRTAFRAAGAGA